MTGFVQEGHQSHAGSDIIDVPGGNFNPVISEIQHEHDIPVGMHLPKLLGSRHPSILDADAGAREDLNDILSCDAVINFTCTPDRGYMTGGRHVEFGFAMAAGLKQFVVGPRENIFHEMVDVTQFDTFSAFINWLRMESQSAGDSAGEAVVLSGERVA